MYDPEMNEDDRPRYAQMRMQATYRQMRTQQRTQSERLMIARASAAYTGRTTYESKPVETQVFRAKPVDSAETIDALVG